MIVLPLGINFEEWAATLYIDLPNLNIPLAPSQELWKEWAQNLLLDNKLVDIPLPQNFSDWRIWAEYFVNNV